MMIEAVHGNADRTVLHGADRVRSYGRVEDEYAAATRGVAVFDRGGDAVVSFTGPKVADMLQGVVTGRIPAEASATDGMVRGAAQLQTVLTPKGKMVSDLVLGRAPDTEGVENFWGLVPAGGLDGLTAHLKRFLPPRFAKYADVSSETARVLVAGPDASALLTRTVLGLRVEPADLDALKPFGWLSVELAPGEHVRVVRSIDLGEVPAFEVCAPASAGAGLWTRMVEGGAVPMGAAAFETLRIEAGTPLYGADMDDATIPTEAGLEEIAIDHTKGCYTGQEVIVRIRDRGHVNRRIRRVLLGDRPTPAPGTELRVEGLDRSAGEVRSAAWSPRFEQAVALAFVRREAWDGSDPQPEFESV